MKSHPLSIWHQLLPSPFAPYHAGQSLSAESYELSTEQRNPTSTGAAVVEGDTDNRRYGKPHRRSCRRFVHGWVHRDTYELHPTHEVERIHESIEKYRTR